MLKDNLEKDSMMAKEPKKYTFVQIQKYLVANGASKRRGSVYDISIPKVGMIRLYGFDRCNRIRMDFYTGSDEYYYEKSIDNPIEINTIEDIKYAMKQLIDRYAFKVDIKTDTDEQFKQYLLNNGFVHSQTKNTNRERYTLINEDGQWDVYIFYESYFVCSHRFVSVYFTNKNGNDYMYHPLDVKGAKNIYTIEDLTFALQKLKELFVVK